MAKTTTKDVQKAQGASPSSLPVAHGRPGLVVSMATKYGIEPDKMLATLKATAFRQRGKQGGPPPEITNEQMMALLLVANEYELNPWTKEIYAFPQEGGIVAVVGVDGWIRMINRHPQFDWMKLAHAPHEPGEIPEWFECTIRRKDRGEPTVIREYFDECKRNTDPWNNMPRRMLRHKAIIQCGRVAFGFTGIYDPDDADYIMNAIDVTPRQGKPHVQPPKAIASEPALATAEQIAQLRTALADAQLEEPELLEQYRLAAIEEFEFDQVASALAWISKNKG